MDARLFEWNQAVESDKSEDVPISDLYRYWVWESDPQEDVHPSVLLNTCHLAGLLYCRLKAKKVAQPFTAITIITTTTTTTTAAPHGRMAISDASPLEMSLQKLLDSVDNICIEWPSFLASHPNPKTSACQKVFRYTELCLIRFGFLASHAMDPAVLDNVLLTETYELNEALRKISLPGLRRFLNSFLILNRHFHLFCNATLPPQQHTSSTFQCAIRHPHVEASMEFFDVLCMHFLIPVGARLRYKNEFRGMYNHISQVIYFHNPDYERIARLPLSQLISNSPPFPPAYQVLPAICELYPEIVVIYEEDMPFSSEWNWLVVAGRLYLTHKSSRQVYWCENVLVLLEIYLQATSVEVSPAATGRN